LPLNSGIVITKQTPTKAAAFQTSNARPKVTGNAAYCPAPDNDPWLTVFTKTP